MENYPESVVLSCTVFEVETVEWGLFSSTMIISRYTYAFTPGDKFPHRPTTIFNSLSGVEVWIISAHQDANNAEILSEANSELHINWTAVESSGILRAQCGNKSAILPIPCEMNNSLLIIL